MQKIKKCYKCKTSKPLAYFGVNNSRKDGVQSCCKSCSSQMNKDYYRKNKKRCMKKIMINKRKRALDNYTKLITKYFNKPCRDCGGVYHPSAMVFDHINGKSDNIFKTEGVMYLVRNGYSWKVIKNEIKKCVVRCQNCHFIKTSKQFNYWSEISDLIQDYSSLIRKIYKYKIYGFYGNFLRMNEFNKQKKEISDRFSEFMLDEIKKITKKRTSNIDNK